MKFDIQSHVKMLGRENYISLPPNIREELGVLIGQFIQLKGSEEIVLQVIKDMEQEQVTALISSDNFKIIKNSPVKFKILEVTLGCDPEFFILQGPHKVRADNLFQLKGVMGQIGHDGELGELRPMYGKHEDQVVSNLRTLILEIPKILYGMNGMNLKYEAHSYYGGMAAGFHVHLGIPREILSTCKDFSGAAVNHMVRCLDWYVSVPLMALEENQRRRLGNSKFGRPGDYKYYNPGGITLEYRTPGAFYLRSPLLARGLLGMSLMLTEHMVSHLKVASQGFLKLDKLTPADLQEIMPIPEPNQIVETLRAQDKFACKKHLSGILDKLQSLENYREHETATSEFFRAVDRETPPNPGLLDNWKE